MPGDDVEGRRERAYPKKTAAFGHAAVAVVAGDGMRMAGAVPVGHSHVVVVEAVGGRGAVACGYCGDGGYHA